MRAVHRFHGGIHPPDNKQQSVRTPIASAGIPPELILPLSQHRGSPARPVIRPGERVLKGQVIAVTDDPVSAPVHAPTSGTISAIEQRVIAHPSALRAPCIAMSTDGLDAWIAHAGLPDFRAHTAGELIRAIRAAGIAGMGGAGFPTATKVSLAPPVRIDTLILNGAECEPYITCDDLLMRERADRIIEGALILRHILTPGEILIGVEDNKPQALAALQTAARDTGIEIVAFPTRYPSGGEKQLIELLTGRQITAGRLPAQDGVLVLNVGTVAAIREAVLLGRPSISRITTVTGAGVQAPANFDVLLGTPIRYLLQQAGFDANDSPRVIVGGPMMGFTTPTLDAPIEKTTNCLLVPTAAELPAPPPAQACIRCGLCAEACPASLLPQQLFWFAQGREYDRLEHHNLFDCIECGACAYVCPSSIPLVQYYRASKSQILQRREDRARSQTARLRFEAREQRLRRDAQEQEAKRAARKLAAAQRAQATVAAGDVDDPIRAAVERVRARKAALQGSTGKESDAVRLEHTVAAAHARLAAARARLAEATAQGSDQVGALEAGVANTQAKLQAAQQALDNYRQVSRTTAAADRVDLPATPSPAMHTHAAASTQEHSRAHLRTLQLRLQQMESALARCRAEGEQDKAILALEATVARLRENIETAQRELPTTGDD